VKIAGSDESLAHKELDERITFAHQQLYGIFLIIFFFTYFIGKSTYAFAILIAQGIYLVVS
jgi:hypothetical protein